MPRKRVGEGALRQGAPFLFLAVGLWWAGTAAASDCPADRVDESVRVAHVYDGDTVRLDDGRKLRFIGINTPEIGRDGAPSQPFAEEARIALESRLAAADGRLTLRFGTERRDKYGRLLAHPYLPDGTSLNALLLEKGLATALTVPPNLWNLSCYREVERQARDAGAGLWSLPRYRVVESRELGPDTEGFRRVAGRVERIGESRHAIWVELEGPFAVRIARSDRERFGHLEALIGVRVLARGWVHPGRRGLRMTVRHPADLEPLGQ